MSHLDPILRLLTRSKRAMLVDGNGHLIGTISQGVRRRFSPVGYRFTRKNDPGPVGRWIKACRTEHGMTQQSLAEAINMNHATVAHWEAGDGLPGKVGRERLKTLFGEMGDA